MRLFYTMLENALLMSALTLLWLLLRRALLSRVRSRTCHVVGIILAIGLLVPLRPAVQAPLFNLGAWQPRQQAALAQQTLPQTTGVSHLAPDDETSPAGLGTNAPQQAASTHSAADANRLAQAAAFLWLTGAAMAACYHTTRHIRFRRQLARWRSWPTLRDATLLHQTCRELGIRRVPALFRCALVDSPMLTGLLRPAVLLPSQSLPDDALRMVLRHELTHLRRGDLWSKALLLAASCVHWFNPLVHRLARLADTDCELACDDAVLKGAGLAVRRAYGAVILSLIGQRAQASVPLSTHLFERRCDMKKRFRAMLDLRPRRAGRVFIVMALLLTLLTGGVLAMAPEDVPTGTAIDVQGDISPTTGMQYPAGRGDDYRPVMVELSNSKEARTQLNLGLADVVYEYIMWGPGYTRFLAVYNDYHPEMVGMVRGSRVHAFELRDGWDCPIFHHGGQDTEGTSIYAYMRENDVPDDMHYDGTRPVTGHASLYARLEDLVVPHNLVVNVQKAVEEFWPEDGNGDPYEPRQPGLRFAKADVTGETRITRINFPFSGEENPTTFRYDEDTARYLRYDENGDPWIDRLTGETVGAENLLVQYVEMSYFDNSLARPIIETVGEGPLDAFINGWHIQGTWKHEDAQSPIAYYGADGKPLLLTPGRTFIELIPEFMDIEYAET